MKTWHVVAIVAVVGVAYLYLSAYSGGGSISVGGPTVTPAALAPSPGHYGPGGMFMSPTVR